MRSYLPSVVIAEPGPAEVTRPLFQFVGSESGLWSLEAVRMRDGSLPTVLIPHTCMQHVCKTRCRRNIRMSVGLYISRDCCHLHLLNLRKFLQDYDTLLSCRNLIAVPYIHRGDRLGDRNLYVFRTSASTDILRSKHSLLSTICRPISLGFVCLCTSSCPSLFVGSKLCNRASSPQSLDQSDVLRSSQQTHPSCPQPVRRNQVGRHVA